MKNNVKKALSKVLSLVMLFSCFTCGQISVSAADTITAVFDGWFETAYAEWKPVEGAGFYEAFVKESGASAYEQLDDELIRQYDTYIRADAVGLPEGTYDMKIEAYDEEGGSLIASAEETGISVSAYDRNGSAFSTQSTYNSEGGIGAYNNDGSLKSNAKVFYVTADTAATISTNVITNSKGTTTACTGIQDILDKYQKGYDTTPLDFRIIGTVTDEDVDSFSSSAEGLQIKGSGEYSLMNITIEGIGNDATVWGFGFLVRNSGNVEFRNFAILNCMDDGISMDTANCNVWVHNMDFFYGQKGSDSDQVKGDGTVDIKADSQYITVSYNHFWDNGKSSLCGMKSETGNNYITYHHNWFDHSDSRHPRVRTMSVHIYNNYYDGNSKYGAASAKSASLFVEQNYFRSCKYPVLIGGQGSEGGTTLSGETGTPIKMYGNIMSGSYKYIDYSSSTSDFDGYTVENRDDQIPEDVEAAGGTYNNFDTEYEAHLGVDENEIDSAADVPGIVMSEAGRCNGGDIFFDIDEYDDDTNSSVIDELRSLIESYETSLRIVGGTVDSSKINSSAAASSATGVDDNEAYSIRDAEQAAEAEALDKTDGGSTGGSSTGGDTSEDDTKTDGSYDLKLVASDISSSAATLTSKGTYVGSIDTSDTGSFTIYATSDSTVTINGDEIRLGGKGSTSGTDTSAWYRVIAVDLTEAGTIYAEVSNLDSASSARTLAVYDTDGTTILNSVEVAIGSSKSVTATADEAGTYYIASTSGGLSVTLVGVTYSSSSSGGDDDGGDDDYSDDGDGDETTEETTETTTEEETEDPGTEETTEAPSGTLVWNLTSGENTLGVDFSGSENKSAATITYEGMELTKANKMESSTSIKFTAAGSGTLTLVFYSTKDVPTVKLDSTSYNLTAYGSSGVYTLTLDLAAGSYTITKGTTNTDIYYASLAYASSGDSGDDDTGDDDEPDTDGTGSGDVSGDDNIDEADAVIALKLASGLLSKTSAEALGYNYEAADCDGNPGITVLDAIHILKNQGEVKTYSFYDFEDISKVDGSEGVTESYSIAEDSDGLTIKVSIVDDGSGSNNVLYLQDESEKDTVYAELDLDDMTSGKVTYEVTVKPTSANNNWTLVQMFGINASGDSDEVLGVRTSGGYYGLRVNKDTPVMTANAITANTAAEIVLVVDFDNDTATLTVDGGTPVTVTGVDAQSITKMKFQTATNARSLYVDNAGITSVVTG